MARAQSTIMSAAEQKSSTAAGKKEAKAALKTARATLDGNAREKAKAEREHARHLKLLAREQAAAQKAFERASQVAQKYTVAAA